MNTGMRRLVQRSIRFGFVIVFLGLTVTTIAMVSVSHSNDDQFNTIVVIYNCILLAAELYFFLVVLYYGRSLEHAIVVTQGAIAGLETVPVKIRYLQTGAFAILRTQLIPFAGSIVFAVSGSTPYYWVIQLCLSYSAIPAITAATYKLAQQHHASSSHSSKRLSKEQSKSSSKTGLHVAPATVTENTTSE